MIEKTETREVEIAQPETDPLQWWTWFYDYTTGVYEMALVTADLARYKIETGEIAIPDGYEPNMLNSSHAHLVFDRARTWRDAWGWSDYYLKWLRPIYMLLTGGQEDMKLWDHPLIRARAHEVFMAMLEDRGQWDEWKASVLTFDELID